MSDTITNAPNVGADHSLNGVGTAPWLAEYDELVPNLDEIITQDYKPVDNAYVERLYHLLVGVLYASWQPPETKPAETQPPSQRRPFLTFSNVGWFHTDEKPAIVPDIMVSLDVVQLDPGTKEGRSYFQWKYGKPADLAVEIVSDARGKEYDDKMGEYAKLGLRYYVVHDPFEVYDKGFLNAYKLSGGTYEPIDPKWIEELGLGLTMWEGSFDGVTRTWLRWCDRHGKVLPTAAEGKLIAHKQVETAEARMQRLVAQLRQAGIEPSE